MGGGGGPSCAPPHADNEADKAKAQADQAKAEARAAESRAAVAADCAKAYIAAFGGLFEGESVRDQAPEVREQLSRITADCKDELAGACAGSAGGRASSTAYAAGAALPRTNAAVTSPSRRPCWRAASSAVPSGGADFRDTHDAP